MPVVAAGKLNDLVAAGDRAGQSQHRHSGFGARVDQSNLFDRHPLDDFASKINFGERRCAVRGSAPRRIGYRADDVRMGVAEQHRAPGTHQVDELIAVDVVEVRTASAGNEAWRAADGSEGPHRGVHTAWRHGLGPLESSLAAYRRRSWSNSHRRSSCSDRARSSAQ